MTYLSRSSIVPSISQAQLKLPLPSLLLALSFAARFFSSTRPNSYNSLPINVDFPASTWPTSCSATSTCTMVCYAPITTRLRLFLASPPSIAFFASSKTFSRARLIFGGGSSAGSGVSSLESRLSADMSNAAWFTCPLDGVAAPGFFGVPSFGGAGEPALEVTAELAPDFTALSCLFAAAFCAFSFSLAAVNYIILVHQKITISGM